MARKFCYFLLMLSVVCYATLGGRHPQEDLPADEVVDDSQEELCAHQCVEAVDEPEEQCCEQAESLEIVETVTETVKCALQPKATKLEKLVSKKSSCPCEVAQEEVVEEPVEQCPRTVKSKSPCVIAKAVKPLCEAKSPCEVAKSIKPVCESKSAPSEAEVTSEEAQPKQPTKTCPGKSCAAEPKVKRELKQKQQPKQQKNIPKNKKQYNQKHQTKSTKSKQ